MKQKNMVSLLILLFCVSCAPAPMSAPNVTPGDLLDPSPSVKPKNAPPPPEHEPELTANPSPATPPDGDAPPDRVFIPFHDPDHEKAFPPDIYDLTANFAARVRGEFTYVEDETTDIPGGLLALIEKALYNDDFNSPELTSPFEIDREIFFARYEEFLNRDNDHSYFSQVYQYALENADYYLLDADEGGSSGFASLYLYKDAGNGLEFCDGTGSEEDNEYMPFGHLSRVISYDGAVFFFTPDINYYSKYWDSAAVCELTADGFSDFTVVSLRPDGRFAWETVYDGGSPANPAVTAYIDDIKEELMSKSPINDKLEIFTGQETPIPEGELLSAIQTRASGKNRDYYEIDFNNDGVTEYFSRAYFLPSNRYRLGLMSDFCLWENGRLVQIGLNFEAGYDQPLIQLWFAELEGKVYTFRLFLNDGYHYLLNVSLIEGDEVTQIQSQIAASKKEYEFKRRAHTRSPWAGAWFITNGDNGEGER